MVRTLIVLASTLVLASCGSMGDLLSGLDKPTAEISGVSLADIDLQSATLVFDVDVLNPYSVDLPVAGFDYGLASGGKSILSGETSGSASIPAKGRKTVPLTAKLPFAQIMSTLSGVKPGAVVPYDAAMGIRLDVPGAESLRIPLQKSGEFPIPTVPQVSVSQVSWESLSLVEAVAKVDLSIVNTNQFPVDLSTLQYAFQLFGADLGNAAIEPGTAFSAGGQQSIPLRFSLKPINMGPAFMNLLKGGEADYGISGLMQLGSQFGDLDLPYDSRGKAKQTR
ncbi:MAG: LEA type 2 family protein [Planctomycetota bacterium]